MSETLSTLLREAARLQREGRRLRACLIVKNRGSTPQSAGSLMLVDDAAQMRGTVGGGCVEAEVRRRAHQMIATDATGVFTFKLDSDYGWDDGLICGGTIDVAIGRLPDASSLETIASALETREHTRLDLFVENEHGPMRYVFDLPPRPRLLIAGAGHIGAAVARHAARMEFAVTLFDDRADLLERIALPGVRTVAGEIADSLRAAAVDHDTYCIVVTRGHRHDAQALHAVVDRGAKYVGMIGSRRKVKLIFDELRERGAPDHALESVHAPIGLDIGAELVEEIAISILAELIQVRRAERVKPVSGPLPLDAAAAASSATTA